MNKKNKIISLFLLIAVIAIAYFWFVQNNKKNNTSHKLPDKFKLGLINDCRKVPKFISKLSMRQPAIDSKQQGHSGGLVIRDLSNNTQWQHASWKLSGFIGAFERDNNGNIYITPTPYVSLKENPPEKQNKLYKIDANSAEMSMFLDFPSTHAPSTKNPFGTMGLTYDCDTQSMYVASIAGSQPSQEHGIIYQIDLTTKKILSTLEHTDAIGLGVFNTLKGKRLYFGSARNPYIYSIPLDVNGHFVGNKRYELSLAEIQGGNTTIAKKIQFSKVGNKYHMTVKETEFGFRLMAENNPSVRKYIFQHSLAQDKWLFLHAVHE